MKKDGKFSFPVSKSVKWFKLIGCLLFLGFFQHPLILLAGPQRQDSSQSTSSVLSTKYNFNILTTAAVSQTIRPIEPGRVTSKALPTATASPTSTPLPQRLCCELQWSVALGVSRFLFTDKNLKYSDANPQCDITRNGETYQDNYYTVRFLVNSALECADSVVTDYPNITTDYADAPDKAIIGYAATIVNDSDCRKQQCRTFKVICGLHDHEFYHFEQERDPETGSFLDSACSEIPPYGRPD